MKRPKWWNIDWVELGCRGWDIETTGADFGPQRESPWEYDYANLDRDTLHLVMSGRPAFIARVITDLCAARLFRLEESSGVITFNFDYMGMAPVTTGNTAGSGSALKLIA